MNIISIDGIFDKIDFSPERLKKGEYQNCTFNNCNFYNSDLTGYIFRECNFKNCDFSLSKIKQTTLCDIRFEDCKLLGIQFHECNSFLFSVRFDRCVLKMSVFYKMRLKKYKFSNCNLEEADFTEADLSNTVFDTCDLHRTVFYNTNLEKADFSTSFNYSFDPERNRIKKARFSKTGALGLLDKYNIELE
jgi:fluoroquinolone resistance protein